MTVWMWSIPWRAWGAERFGLVLLPDGYFFVGFFTVMDAANELRELTRRR